MSVLVLLTSLHTRRVSIPRCQVPGNRYVAIAIAIAVAIAVAVPISMSISVSVRIKINRVRRERLCYWVCLRFSDHKSAGPPEL